jgi:hypothetical protein
MKKLFILLLITATFSFNVNLKMVSADFPKLAAFTDIIHHWALNSILQAIQKGYVEGYPNGTFKPDMNVTRAEFIKLIVASLKLPLATSTPNGNWYDIYVDAAKNAGIVVSSDFTDGDLNKPMTRYEMSRTAVRAAGQTNTDAKKWMYLATNVGLIMGMDKTGTLGEDQTTTRAQAVSIIERILSIKSGKQIPTDKHAISRAEVAWHGTNIYSMMPRYFNPANSATFSLDKAKWDSSDGNYHEEVVEYVVVDMGDPNDPFRSEVEGIKFDIPNYDQNGNYIGGPGKIILPPSNSYVTFSKLKQVIKGVYPKSLLITQGGAVQMEQIGVKINSQNIARDWNILSINDSQDKITSTKSANSDSQESFNMAHGNPYFVNKDITGTLYWTSAQLFPKGDLVTDGHALVLLYFPNIRYVHDFGPVYFNRIITDVVRDNIHNE